MSASTAIMTLSSPSNSKNENEQGSCIIEDGELPEEGEIMEEDEEIPPKEPPASNPTSLDNTKSSSSKKPASIMTPLMEARPLMSTTTIPAIHKPLSKYKDYDPKATKQANYVQDAMLNSWVSGVERKSGTKNSGGSPSYDPNDEYYGVSAKNSNQQSNEGGENSDKDNRGAPDGCSYDDLNLFGDEDVDYRQPQHSARAPMEGGVDRRRRRSGSPEGYRFAKRGRQHLAGLFNSADSPPSLAVGAQIPGGPQQPRFGGRTRLGGQVPHWAEHTICKFFREGYCRDSEDCIYSHKAADSNRRPELCKFYQHGYCKKGMMCQHLHGEYPCKAFHKGECTKEQCQYSHQPLDEFTQPIYDQMVKDEELTARISIPNQPLRRKVLLPLGPETTSDGSHDSNQGNHSSSQIPPPSVVVPVLSSIPPNSFNAEEKVMAATGTYGFFNPITPISSSNNSRDTPAPLIPPPSLLAPPAVSSTPTTSFPATSGHFFGSGVSHFPPVTSSGNTPSNSSTSGFLGIGGPSKPSTSIMGTSTTNNNATSSPLLAPLMSLGTSSNHQQKETKSEPAISGAFNINHMLEQITQQVTAQTNEMDDSPASPPHVYEDHSNETKLIPVLEPWRFEPVDEDLDVDADFEYASQLIQKMSTSNAFQSDPRLKKMVEKQFDLATKALEIQNSINAQKLIELSHQTTTTSSSQNNATNSGPSTSLASNNNSTASASKMADPRSRDPRKKASSTSTTGTTNNNNNGGGGGGSGGDYETMIATQIEMANKMAQQNQQSGHLEDVDHRPPSLIRQATTTTIGGAPIGLRPAAQIPMGSGGILGGLFAPLPFTSGFGGGLTTNATMNPYGPAAHSKSNSPPSLFDSTPTTSFGGAFNSGALNSGPDAFGNFGFQNGQSTTESGNNFTRPANRFFPVHQRNSSRPIGVGGGGGGGPGGRNPENNNYGNKREFFGNSQDNEISVNHFSRWDPSSGNNNNNNSYRQPPPQRSPILNHNSNSNEMDTTTSKPPPTTTASAMISPSTEAPISLREKRKNNEYESPLARVRY